jgi:hypothetical protein
MSAETRSVRFTVQIEPRYAGFLLNATRLGELFRRSDGAGNLNRKIYPIKDLLLAISCLVVRGYVCVRRTRPTRVIRIRVFVFAVAFAVASVPHQSNVNSENSISA